MCGCADLQKRGSEEARNVTIFARIQELFFILLSLISEKSHARPLNFKQDQPMGVQR
jgi:hypothetical protein